MTLHLVTENRQGRYRSLQRTTGELAAQNSRHVGSTEGGLAYAVVVAGRTDPQLPSGPHKPPANGSGHSEPAALSEAATRRISLGDMSESLCGMPDGTTLSAQEATSSVAPAGERRKRPLRGDGQEWIFALDTGLVSEWALSPD